MDPVGGDEVRSRNRLFSILIILGVVIMWLVIVAYFAIFVGAQFYSVPPTSFYLVVWAIPYFVAAGIAAVAAIYVKDINRGLFDASIGTSVVLFIRAVSNGFFAYFATSVWARCVTGIASLDTAEKIMCNNNQWLLYVQLIFAWLFLITGVIGLGVFIIDAFMRFNTRQTAAKLLRGVRKAGGKVKKFATTSEPIPNVQVAPFQGYYKNSEV